MDELEAFLYQLQGNILLPEDIERILTLVRNLIEANSSLEGTNIPIPRKV